MRKTGVIIFCFIVLISFSIQAQKKSSNAEYLKGVGVGVKFGNINGLTVKKYLGNKRALELIVGRAYYWWASYNDPYYFYFHDHRFDKGLYKGNKIYSEGLPSSFSMQLRYLVHKDLSSILPNLNWYFGGGVQMRTFLYHYYYDDNNGREFRNVVDVGIGVDGIAGLEYTFKELPLSIFVDANLYTEIFNNPFLFDGQAGTGIRYNFR